jgi:hypothetical protein
MPRMSNHTDVERREMARERSRRWARKNSQYYRDYYDANKERVDAYRQEWRERTKDEKAAYDKEYRELNKEELAIKRRDYAKANVDKALVRNRTYRQAHPDRYAAHCAVNNAVQSGKLIKEPCEECGTTETVQAHHDDYSQPLYVRWLCVAHHTEVHTA